MSISGLSRRLIGVLPTLTVLTLLGSVLYLGHVRGWRLEEPGEKKANTAKTEVDFDEPPIVVKYEDSPFGSLPITHDPQKCKLVGKVIEFKDSSALHKAGVNLGKVEMRPMDHVLTVTA